MARKDDGRAGDWQYVDPESGKITFASFYADWSTRQIWVPSTRRAMDLAAGSVPFGAVPFADLRASHVEVWVKAMQDKELAPGTIRTRFQNVRAVVRSAVRDPVLAHDVTAAVRLPRVRSAAKAMTIPTPAQVGSLLSSAPAGFAAFVALAAFAGLRSGEASAVKVSDLNFLKRELTVCRQVQRAEGHRQEIRAPKYGSERTVYVPDALLALLSEHIRQHCPGDDPDRWLFPGDDDDMPIHENRVFWLWKKTREDAGVSCKLHSLRHFYASGSSALGVTGDGAARPRAPLGDGDSLDVRAPVAGCQRPHPQGSGGAVRGLAGGAAKWPQPRKIRRGNVAWLRGSTTAVDWN